MRKTDYNGAKDDGGQVVLMAKCNLSKHTILSGQSCSYLELCYAWNR